MTRDPFRRSGRRYHRGRRGAREKPRSPSGQPGARVVVNDLWRCARRSATERGFSFVISKESRSGPGLHGPPGFVASWRPINVNKPAIKVGGSPFDTFAEAEKACEAFLRHLTS